MDRFLSTFTNKVDAKGRVSVPASFRAILATDGLDGVYCYPSLETDALDCGGQSLIGEIHELLKDIAPYSDERAQLSTALFGDSEVLGLDQDGRVILPKRLRDHAGIEGRVTFVGLGDRFRIWNPERFDAYREEARSKTRDLRNLLGAGRRESGEAGGARE